MVTENLSLRRTAQTASFSWRKRVLTRPSQVSLDVFVFVSAFMLSYLLRFDFHVPERETQTMLHQLPFVLSLQLAVLWLCGIYAFIWRYIGLAEMKAFVMASLWAALPMVILRTWLPESLQVARIPLSIIVMDTVLGFGGLLGLRVLRRVSYEYHARQQNGAGIAHRRRLKKPILLIGAGRAGVLAAREIRLRGDVDLDVKGFVDDDPAKQGSVIQGVKVLGRAEDIPRLVDELRIDHVVISFAQASRREFRRILDICESGHVKVRTVPGLHEILQGDVKVSRIRDVQIEDLLGREQVHLDEDSMRDFLQDKVVMVTGAGGSIGSELVRQVARFRPRRLLLVERAEFALFEIDHEMRRNKSEANILPLVADVGDLSRMRAIFQAYEPQVILHAAAHKHVPMMETNPSEAVKNNVLATRQLGELASEFGAEAFVLISTDKAVRPSSVMGASKRVAELVIQDLNQRSITRFVAVRFGNVIGSAGSVIPIFREQIKKGGPVTVTHPEMVRYFMTIPEAAQLVLQAGALGEGGEILILDMGEPVRILDLAKETIELSGLRPFDDINIVFTGVRAGEKLFEELQTTGEEVLKTKHPKIFIGKIARDPDLRLDHALERLALLAKKGWDEELRGSLNELLPEASLSVANEAAIPLAAFRDRALAAGAGESFA